jgi:hypothetical protein
VTRRPRLSLTDRARRSARIATPTESGGRAAAVGLRRSPPFPRDYRRTQGRVLAIRSTAPNPALT